MRFRSSIFVDGVLHYRCHGKCGQVKPSRDYSPSKYVCKACYAEWKRERDAAERAAYKFAAWRPYRARAKAGGAA